MRWTPRWLLLAMFVVLMAGCAAGKVAYEKPGGTEVDRRRDVAECVQASIGHEPGRHVVTPVVVDREAFARCLESRGYSQVR